MARSSPEPGAPTQQLQRIRVVVFLPRLGIGGTERHLLETLPGLSRERFEVRVVATRGAGSLDDEMRQRGIPVTVATSLNARVPALVAAVFRIAWRLRRERPDIVHFYLPEAYLVAGAAAVLAGVRPRVMSRRSLNDYHQRRRFSRRAELWLHRRMDRVLANSEAVARQLRDEAVASARLQVIRSGIDDGLTAGFSRTAVRRSLDIADDTFVIICVANLIAYKGHQDLLEALALVRGRLPSPWSLLLVGRDEGIAAALKDYAKQQGIDGNIQWMGESGEVPALLAASDLAVLASHEEGLPKSVLEAMAAGLPVVATRVGGVPELVVDGTTGLIVPPRDPLSLSQAIDRLAGNRPELEQMGRAGHARVAEKFQLRSCIAAYESLYEELVAPD